MVMSTVPVADHVQEVAEAFAADQVRMEVTSLPVPMPCVAIEKPVTTMVESMVKTMPMAISQIDVAAVPEIVEALPPDFASLRIGKNFHLPDAELGELIGSDVARFSGAGEI